MDAFVGAIFSFGFNFAPYGWAECNGQLLPISQYQALYSLIGTTYGGDGVQTFALPNMQGRVPIGTGQGPALPNYTIGEVGGNESVTLLTSNLPVHTHPVLSVQLPVNSSTGTTDDPTGAYFEGSDDSTIGQTYNGTGGVTMAAVHSNTGIAGSNIPIGVLSPYLAINYCISLFGIFPTRN